MKRRDALAIAAAGGVLALGAGVFAGRAALDIGPTMPGVDVSHHQGAIDWRALAADGAAFAYIKASEGASYVDRRFAINWREVDDARLLRGAYHFFTLCRPGLAQAEHFLSTVSHDAHALPPALDLEHMGPCRNGPTATDVLGEAKRFLDRVEEALGVRPIVYTTRTFHDAHLTELARERFWLRSLFRPPDFRVDDWVIWQHHNRGRRRGVQGPVDLNLFRGDAPALLAFAGLTT